LGHFFWNPWGVALLCKPRQASANSKIFPFSTSNFREHVSVVIYFKNSIMEIGAFPYTFVSQLIQSITITIKAMFYQVAELQF